MRAEADGMRTEVSAFDEVDLIYSVACKVAEVMVQNRLSPPPLQNFRELEEAVEKGWLLPTSKVKDLIGVKPSSQVFERGSFRFVRRGKIGAEAAWRVEKNGEVKKADRFVAGGARWT